MFLPFPDYPLDSGFDLTANGHRAVLVVEGTGVIWDHRDGLLNFANRPQGSVIPEAISADGLAVTGTFRPQSFGRPFHWTAAGGLIDIGSSASNNHSEFAFDISDDGQTVIGSYPTGLFIWTSSTGALAIPGMNTAAAISADGSLIAGDTYTTAFEAALWSPTAGITNLGDLPGGLFESSSRAMTTDGSVVVGYGRDPSGLRPMRWSASTGMVALGNPGEWGGSATGVSSNGARIVGQGYELSSGLYKGFFWSTQTGIVPMRDHLINLGVLGLGQVEIEGVSAISDDGNAVTGRMRGPNGVASFVAFFDQPGFSIGTGYCGPAEVNSTGFSGHLMAAGSEFVVDNDLTLEVFNIPEGQIGIFLASEQAGFTSFPGGSQGNLCLGGSIGRFNLPTQMFTASSSGQAHLSVDLTAIPGPLGPRVGQAGQTWFFQAWYRDQNPNQASNFTDAVSVMYQ